MSGTPSLTDGSVLNKKLYVLGMLPAIGITRFFVFQTAFFAESAATIVSGACGLGTE
ncbi:MAG: hypothetical protein MZV64_27760 [Ignavibacteriales bacterium]|nr:hypothetical protein [Ignavibacteriales bacterium]